MLRHLKSALAVTETSAPPTPDAREDVRSWAIQRKPSELERALWHARKVNIYDMDIDAFVYKLREKMGM